MYKFIFEDYKKRRIKKFNPIYNCDDDIENILNYFKISSYHKSVCRKKYDGDARYFFTYGAESQRNTYYNGDTMVSFYTPYKRAILLETGNLYHKSVPEHLDLLIDRINIDGYDRVNEKFRLFAHLYHTRGNLLFLPNHKMNCKKFYVSADRIDKALAECFAGGRLSEFFRNDEVLKEWIKKEHLDVCFTNGIISKKNICCNKISKPYNDMDKNELYKYIDWIIEIISKRNEKFNKCSKTY